MLALSALAGGCASKPVATDSSTPARPALAYADAEASALVFDPPSVEGERAVELSRALRGPAAFAGYDSVITTYSSIRLTDEQNSIGYQHQDYFDRRAVTERTSINSR